MTPLPLPGQARPAGGQGGVGLGHELAVGAGPLSVALPCLLPYQIHSRPQTRGHLTVAGCAPDPCHSSEAKGHRVTGPTDPVCGPASCALSGLNNSKRGLTLVRKLHVTLQCAYFLFVSMPSLKIKTFKSLIHLKFISKAWVID